MSVVFRLFVFELKSHWERYKYDGLVLHKQKMIESFQSFKKKPSKTLVGMIAAFLKIEKLKSKITLKDHRSNWEWINSFTKK